MSICSNKSLDIMNDMSTNFTLALLDEGACHDSGVHSTHVGEVKDIQLIS